MNGKFCLDKRLGYLMLFAVPVLVVVIISSIINNNKITENSKASEMPVETVQITPKPTGMPTRGTCLIPRKGADTGTINLYMARPDGYKDDRLFKIYATDGKYFILMTLSMLPSSPGGDAIATVRSATLTGGREYRFIGLQGDDTDISMTGKWGLMSKDCTPFTIE